MPDPSSDAGALPPRQSLGNRSPDRDLIPVIAIDGPTASGKGAVAAGVARRLGWHYLDSGSLYRLVALDALRARHAFDDEAALRALAINLDVEFDEEKVVLRGEDVTKAIRDQAVGGAASMIAVLPGVRTALLARQRAFLQPPGLVADGRDMASVVFPTAMLKVFLTATVSVRADRRHKQLIEKGFSAKLSDLRTDLEARDARDGNRAVAPLAASADSVVIDSSDMDLESVVDRVVQLAGFAA